MRENLKHNARRRRYALLLCALLFALLLGGCSQQAQPSGTVVEPTELFYAADYSGVLSAETEDRIVTVNDALFEQTGAQVVVVTVDFIGSADIEDYAYTLFNEWGIGSAERNNGVLLLLVIGNDDYWVMTGYGLAQQEAAIVNAVYENLEPDFAVGEYDSGVNKAFEAIVAELEGVYGPLDLSAAPAGPAGGQAARPAGSASGGISLVFYIILGAIALVVIVVISSFCGLFGGGWRYHRPPGGGVWFGPPRPPRRPFWGGRPRGPRPGPGPGPGGFGGGPRPGGHSGPRGGGGGGTRGGGGGRR